MESVKANAVINEFLESKKLTLSKSKCHRIHMGKKKDENSMKRPNLKVHNDRMEDSVIEKYLGDIVDKTGQIRATIEDRKRKGFGILAEITAILNDVPLGSKRFEMGMTLRPAWFINGTLYNSEVWCAFSKTDIDV